jgi:hypothetical protein
MGQAREPGTTELDDIDAYIATLDDEERRDLAVAEAAIDLAILRHRAAECRDLSQARPAKSPKLVAQQEQDDARGIECPPT